MFFYTHWFLNKKNPSQKNDSRLFIYHSILKFLDSEMNRNRKIFPKLIGNLLKTLKTQFYKDKSDFVYFSKLHLWSWWNRLVAIIFMEFFPRSNVNSEFDWSSSRILDQMNEKFHMFYPCLHSWISNIFGIKADAAHIPIVRPAQDKPPTEN